MPRVPAHLCERALGMLQGGMRTADVARAINCIVRTEAPKPALQGADHPRRGRPLATTPVSSKPGSNQVATTNVCKYPE